jgi:AraC-like DNA-binding protein
MRPFARSASLTGYADLCRSLGLDPASLMSSVGLEIADLDVPDRWVPAAPMARLLELSARDSGCDDFAVRLSERRALGSLGPLSVVLREEPDLRGVLDLLSRYAHAYTGVLDLRLTEEDRRATLDVRVEFGEAMPTRQVQDLVMGNLAGIIRILIRPTWVPTRARFAHGGPADRAAFHRVFGTNLHFDAEFTGLVLDSVDLDAPVVTADASVRPYTRQLLRSLVLHPGDATRSQEAARVVELLLPHGRCSLEEVARHLGVRPRLLQQQLAGEGESFSSVVHSTRARLAEHYLSIDRLSLTEISLLLGFAAPSAFSRWFRQQFAVSPTAWRDSARVLPVDGFPVRPIRMPPARPSSGGGSPSRPASAAADD